MNRHIALVSLLIGFVFSFFVAATVWAQEMSLKLSVTCYGCTNLHQGDYFPIAADVTNSSNATETVAVTFSVPLSWVNTSNDLVKVVNVGPGETAHLVLESHVDKDTVPGSYVLGTSISSGQLITSTAVVAEPPPSTVCASENLGGCDPPTVVNPPVYENQLYLPLIEQ